MNELIDPPEAERNRQRDEQRRLLEAEDFRWIMEHAQGRRFINRLLDRTGVYRSSFTGNSETFFREGARNVGLQLLAQINDLCPEKYPQMLQEMKDA